MFKKAALLAVGVQALPLHEPRGRRLPPDTVAFCVPPMGSGAAIEGAAEGLADYTGYRAVLLVGAAADGSMGWWDKTCGFPFHPACPGGGLGYPLEADGSFTMAGWASHAGDDQAEGFVVAVVPPSFNWGAFADPEGAGIPAVLASAPQLQQASQEGAGCGIASPSPSPSVSPTASVSPLPAQASASGAPTLAVTASRLPDSRGDIQAQSGADFTTAGAWAVTCAALLATAATALL